MLPPYESASWCVMRHGQSSTLGAMNARPCQSLICRHCRFVVEPIRAFLRRLFAENFFELRQAGDGLAGGEVGNGILDCADDVAALVGRLRGRAAKRLRDPLSARCAGRAEAAPREERADD